MGVFDDIPNDPKHQSQSTLLSEELDLEGIDDEELDREFLRKSDEIVAQEEIWTNINGEHMLELTG